MYILLENAGNITMNFSGGMVARADDESTWGENVAFYQVDATQWFAIALSTTSYSIRFQSTANKINVSLFSGVGDGLDNSLQYLDLALTTGTRANIDVTNAGVSKMKVDADGNGSYETESAPYYSKLGSPVADAEEPIVSIKQSSQGVAVETEDSSSIKQIYYSWTERTGRLLGDAIKYTGPISTLGHSIGDSIYIIAEDSVGNRGQWEAFTIDETSPTPTPTASGGTPTPTPTITSTPTPTGLQIPTPTPTPFPTGSLSQLYVGKNINCNGTIYYVNQYTQKEGYPSPAVYFAWNSSFNDVQKLDTGTCSIFPDGGTTRLPVNSLVKVDGNKTVWKIDGNVAYPIATYEAMLRIDPTPNVITIPLTYLHTYSGGGAIY